MDRTEFLLECERALVEIRDLVLEPDDKVSSDWLAEAVAFPSGIVGAARERMNNEQADREFCRRTFEIIDQLERETRPLLGLAAEDENTWDIVWGVLIERCKRLQTSLDNTHALINATPALSERLDNAQLSAAMWEATEASRRLEAKADKLAAAVQAVADDWIGTDFSSLLQTALADYERADVEADDGATT